MLVFNIVSVLDFSFSYWSLSWRVDLRSPFRFRFGRTFLSLSTAKITSETILEGTKHV